MADFIDLKFHVQKVLPLVYDDSLSYYEQLLHFGNKINEVIDEWNDFQEKFESAYKEYTDQEVAKLKIELLEKLEATVEELNTKYTEFTGKVDDTLANYNVTIEKLKEDVAKSLASSEAYTDSSIANYDAYIKNYINNQVIDIKVINYFTGLKVTIQEMFDYLAQFHLTNAISYTQLASREITFVDYRDLNMTYTQLAIEGNNLIPQK